MITLLLLIWNVTEDLAWIPSTKCQGSKVMDIYCTEADHFRASWPLPWVWSAIPKLRQHWALWIQEWWIFFIFFGILPFILLSSPVTTCRPCWTELISSSWELLCLFQSPDPRNNIFQLGLLTFTHWAARQKSPGFDNTAWLSCDFNFVVLPTVGLFFSCCRSCCF